MNTIPSFSSVEAAKQIHLPKLEMCLLYFLEDTFNTAAFFEFMEEHKFVDFILIFQDNSHEKLLQAYVQKLVKRKEYYYPPPYFSYPNQDIKLVTDMRQLHEKFADFHMNQGGDTQKFFFFWPHFPSTSNDDGEIAVQE